MDNGSTMERKVYMDAVKGWGILMVAFGHITKLGNPVDVWFSSYKLAVFFVASGYLLSMRKSFQRYSLREYFMKQIRTLMVPYIGFSILTMTYHVAVGIMKSTPWPSVWQKLDAQLYATISGHAISALWFLPALFIGQMLFFVVMKTPTWFRVVMAVVPPFLGCYIQQRLAGLEQILSERSYMHISYPVTTVTKGVIAFWFIGCGYLAYGLLQKVRITWIKVSLGIIFFLGNLILSQMNSGIDFRYVQFGIRPELFFLGGIVGSLGLILLLEYLERWWKMPFLSFCGKNSLIIMSTHVTLGFKDVLVAGWDARYTISAAVGLRYYLQCTGILAELMLLETGVIAVVNRCFPWLAGKYKKK